MTCGLSTASYGVNPARNTMEAILNFRDSGGWPATKGLRVKRGLVFRSGGLAKASDRDLAEIRTLGIRLICDLRTERERARHPDRLDGLPGITYRHIPMKSRRHDDSGIARQLFSLLVGKARRMRFDEVMKEVYQEYVTDFRAELSAVLRMVLEPENLPILIHCTAGKDRTGLVAAFLLTALGASSETIVEDYLRSNCHLSDSRHDIMRRLARLSPLGVSPERVIPLFEARRPYLDAAFDQIATEYGTFDRYLGDGLGFSAEDRTRLGDLLLERVPPARPEGT